MRHRLSFVEREKLAQMLGDYGHSHSSSASTSSAIGSDLSLFSIFFRLLRRHEQLRCIMTSHFEHFQQDASAGLLAILNEFALLLNLTRTSPYQFSSQDGISFYLLDSDHTRFQPSLRTCLHHFVLTNSAAYRARQDMQGGPLLHYESNIFLI